ncbi:LysR family transcriptional regulator [Halomonas mongoliensis]|uniref:LysR family transcriptional regulator n=1 Tax=Halomonas mongoliensis TaxID=321265 RepID=A0ABU1GK21_9GAMM|nr:LysR family transcriptional regulator [Halomonas mongoliensis]MDR5892314.1 LysR family transcriptional regulator [Halomonas mongoliensis]
MHDFDELNAFASVMASGSLTRSARELGLAKSTLSRRISHLEARLGQPLLRRQANRLIPTEAGLVFHDYCRDMLTLAERSQAALDELREEVSGELAIEAHCALTRSWLAPVLDAFLARYPEVELTLRTCDTPCLHPDSRGVSVWLGKVPCSALRQESLGALTRGLHAHPDYLARRGAPDHPRELAQHAWIDLLGANRDGVALHHRDGSRFDFQPPVSRLRVDLPELQLDAVARGRGLGLLPHWMVARREHHHPGELVACLPEWQPEPLPITLLYPFGHQPRRVTALLDCLRQAVPEAWQKARQAA